MSFDAKLATGLAGESVIARWLLRRGWNILPAYEKLEMDFKGPRILSTRGELIAPDMLAFRFGDNGEQIHWIEAKTKSAFTWYRNQNNGPGVDKGGYQDGIDKRCWVDYVKVHTLVPWPVWLMFLHEPGKVAKDDPEGITPPNGLFGNTLGNLQKCVDHESDKWGHGGMVYWRESSLLKIAKWHEL